MMSRSLALGSRAQRRPSPESPGWFEAAIVAGERRLAPSSTGAHYSSLEPAHAVFHAIISYLTLSVRHEMASDSKKDLRADSPGELSSAEEVAAFVAKVKAVPPVQREPGKRGRLVFAMDATMSRQPTWDRALHIQSDMFTVTEAIGGLDVQLVYFRGFHECRASKWASTPSALARLMTGIECRGGTTQISRVLTHIRREASARKIAAAVYVGDAMEENIDELCAKAGEIGLLGVPLFMFQEGRNMTAERAFTEMARLTRGAYLRLGGDSARLLRELLTAVAVYAAGGRQALQHHTAGAGARLLLEQLG